YRTMKILIAAGPLHTVTELQAILNEEGHECFVVEDSHKVVETVYVELPELVMLDITLSRPSSIEMLLQLKSAPSTRDIPVFIILSGKSVRKMAKCYEFGAYDYISRPFFREEVIARTRNIGYVCDKMKEVEKLFVRDYLTGLYNRKFFMERLDEELAWAGRYGEPLSFVILDIDHFKKVNDTYGHSCGDEILVQLSKTLGPALRAHDILARYGGEEFVVLLANTDIDAAVTVAEKLRAAVQENDFFCPDMSIALPVTISVGVACTDGNFDITPDSLIKRADGALYEAKAAGRNRVKCHNETGKAVDHEG
ncbi:MAG TPA: diguanylate cyclase, partial [Dissulfurispiraceae bacterium]|nr:diguanylate cyclase [Dissulfurispiraceae bacterium]